MPGSEQVAREAGISYRQLDHWIRRGWVIPDGEASPGSGFPREWTDAEALVVRVMGRLVRAGLPPHMAHEIARSRQSVYEIGPGVLVTLRVTIR